MEKWPKLLEMTNCKEDSGAIMELGVKLGLRVLLFFMLRVTHFHEVKLQILLELGLNWRAGFIQEFTVCVSLKIE